MSFNPKSPETVELLLRRRSAKARRLLEPGPSDEELRSILSAGMRVPDHGKLTPWRFLVVRGAAQTRLGQAIYEAYAKESDDAGGKKHESWRDYASQAPLLIITVSRPSDARPIPEWEQRLSAGAACQNMVVAAHAMGYLANWLTGWPAYSPGVKAALDLEADDRIAGFLFIGSYKEELKERPRPDFDDIVKFL
jgi:nitroreductase